MADKDVQAAEHSRRYLKTARIMMLFVVAYIGQWWTLVAYGIWTLFGQQPHIAIVTMDVFFPNLGGVWNFLAYTFLRNK